VHVDYICSKARQAASLILRCFLSPSIENLCQAFVTFVRPLIEYGTPVFNSLSIADSRKLESIQRWFTRLIFRKCHISYGRVGYESRLRYLGLQKLSTRRSLNDLSFLHRVYNGHQYCPDTVTKKTNSRAMRHNCRLVVDAYSGSFIERSWPQRCINLWNSLPDNIITSSCRNFDAYIRENINDP
jgi:hypothetical protein